MSTSTIEIYETDVDIRNRNFWSGCRHP